MKIIPCEQGSVEWSIARAGVPTASEFDQLLTPELEPRKGQMVKSYLAKKLAERWLGGPLAVFNSFDMEQGKILEEEAIPWFELEFNHPIERVGFITTDDGKIGCSPDGLLSQRMSGIEIKCPAPQTHAGYLLANELPKDYAAQVHGGMFVSGLDGWTFLSYRRRFPALTLTIERDEKIISRIEETLGYFVQQLDAAFERLCEINGGPPIRPRTFTAAPKAQMEPLTEFDVIP